MKKVYLLFVSILITLIFVACKSEITRYKVIFNYQCLDIESTEVMVDDGEKISFPEEAVREGFIFDGWYFEETTENAVANDYIIKNDITIYAKWEEIVQHKIIFDYQCQTIKPTESTVNTGEIISFPKEVLREGYTFGGWYFEETTENVVASNYIITSDITVYAKWDIEVVDLTPDIPATRTELTTYKDITYKIVDGQEIKMDLYLPKTEEGEKCPVLFFYFGGGWIFGSKEDITYGQYIVDKVLAAGIGVIAPNYRLANISTTYPEPVEDVMDSIRFIVKYSDILGIDTENMGSVGYSAGGYMATMAAFAQDFYQGDEDLAQYEFKLKYLVDMYGPTYFDYEEADKLSSTGKFMLGTFLGSYIFKTKENEKAMPSYYVTYNNPVVFIVHGMEDSLVPVSQSIKFHRLLLSNGVTSELHTVSGAEHTLYTASGFDHTTPSLYTVYGMIADFIIAQNN